MISSCTGCDLNEFHNCVCVHFLFDFLHFSGNYVMLMRKARGGKKEKGGNMKSSPSQVFVQLDIYFLAPDFPSFLSSVQTEKYTYIISRKHWNFYLSQFRPLFSGQKMLFFIYIFLFQFGVLPNEIISARLSYFFPHSSPSSAYTRAGMFFIL